jgi:hypothetical protein
VVTSTIRPGLYNQIGVTKPFVNILHKLLEGGVLVDVPHTVVRAKLTLNNGLTNELSTELTHLLHPARLETMVVTLFLKWDRSVFFPKEITNCVPSL